MICRAFDKLVSWIAVLLLISQWSDQGFVPMVSSERRMILFDCHNQEISGFRNLDNFIPECLITKIKPKIKPKIILDNVIRF